MDEHGSRLLAALDAHGVLLQHDKILPSATGVVAGEPVAGSWWSHPLAHEIYGALNDLEDEGLALRAKLVAGKVTMVARRLWPALAGVGGERADWQLDGLSTDAVALLAAVDETRDPELLDGTTRAAGRELERRLLVHVEEVHLPSGAHTKGLLPWTAVVAQHGIAADVDGPAGRAALAGAVAAWGGDPARLLPW